MGHIVRQPGKTSPCLQASRHIKKCLHYLGIRFRLTWHPILSLLSPLKMIVWLPSTGSAFLRGNYLPFMGKFLVVVCVIVIVCVCFSAATAVNVQGQVVTKMGQTWKHPGSSEILSCPWKWQTLSSQDMLVRVEGSSWATQCCPPSLASPYHSANHSQGLSDAVPLLLEGFLVNAAWRWRLWVSLSQHLLLLLLLFLFSAPGFLFSQPWTWRFSRAPLNRR